MTGKSKGTGLLNYTGKVVKEIKAKVSDFVNYQNDGMGCPTSEVKKPKSTKLKRVK